MRVLLVGAGAVGAVFGWHLHRGGAEVVYLVRAKHADALADGLVLYPVNRRRPFAEPVIFREFGVLTDDDAAAAQTWDYVLLCVSSPALHAGTWLDALAKGCGGAPFAAIQPGVGDYAYVVGKVGAARVLWGMFGLMSWAADADTDGVPRPGTAFWRPPGGGVPWSGPAAAGLVAASSAGGLPSHVHPDVQRELAFMGPLLEVHTLALECAGFEFARLRADRELMADAHAALADCVALAVKVHGGRPPFVVGLVRPWVSRLLLWLAPKVVSFDIEAFFRRHYTKVGDQSLALVREKVERARELGVPADGLQRMADRLERARKTRAASEARSEA
jgi:hypothetical protein